MLFLDSRKCHNDESTLPPWKQAVLGQITSGVSSVITKLSKIVPSANNKSTVNIPTPTTSNLSPHKEQLEHAKRALDFEEEEKENSQQKGKIVVQILITISTSTSVCPSVCPIFL